MRKNHYFNIQTRPDPTRKIFTFRRPVPTRWSTWPVDNSVYSCDGQTDGR